MLRCSGCLFCSLVQCISGRYHICAIAWAEFWIVYIWVTVADGTYPSIVSGYLDVGHLKHVFSAVVVWHISGDRETRGIGTCRIYVLIPVRWAAYLVWHVMRGWVARYSHCGVRRLTDWMPPEWGRNKVCWLYVGIMQRCAKNVADGKIVKLLPYW